MDAKDAHHARIRDAYRDLAPDTRTEELLAGVQARMRSRRHGRMAARASALAVCAAAVVAGIAAWHGTESPTRQHADDFAATSDDAAASASVVMRRSGISAPELTQFTASCEAVPSDQGVEQVLRLSTSGRQDANIDTPYLVIQGGVDDLVPGGVLTLPIDDLGPGSERTPLNFEVAAWFPGTPGTEASSTTIASTGTVTVERANCGGAPEASFRVDLTLYSEQGGAPVRLTGTAQSD